MRIKEALGGTTMKNELRSKAIIKWVIGVNSAKKIVNHNMLL